MNVIPRKFTGIYLNRLIVILLQAFCCFGAVLIVHEVLHPYILRKNGSGFFGDIGGQHICNIMLIAVAEFVEHGGDTLPCTLIKQRIAD